MRAPPLELRVAGALRPSFRLAGEAGFAAALALGLGLAWAAGRSPWLAGGLWVLCAATFLALALAVKAVTGEERLVYHHHEAAALTAAALALWAAGQPLLAHLDLVALGVGTVLAFGRLGCLAAGCCHGRPARRGLRYGASHVRDGFPAALEGVPLLPVAAFEAAGVAALVGAGSALVAGGAPAGTALVLYLGGRALLRLGLEALRGDVPRRQALGLRGPQWWALGTALALALGAAAGALPAGGLVLALAGAAALLAAALVVGRRAGSPVPHCLPEGAARSAWTAAVERAYDRR